MPRITPARSAATFAVFGTCALVATGCGGGVPSNSVAKVGGSNITKKDFDHWLKNASAGQAQQGGAAVTPDPPNFTKCVASLKKTQGKGAGKQSDSALKKQCKTQYDSLKGEVMQFLIQAQWVTQEAKNRNVSVSDADVQKAFQQQKKQAFPKEADYKKFLKTSGMTEADILYRLRLDQLQTKLTKEVTKGKATVTDADVQGYYNKNKKRFAQPASRDLDVVVTKTAAKGNEAKSAIQGGQSFKAVSKKFSIDQQSKAQGGKLPGLVKGRQDKALDKAVFSAKKGQLTGPVKTQLGYYVFEVSNVTKASQQTEKQAASTIKNLLKSQRQQKALNDFIKDFRKKYKDKTNCGKDFRVAECKNAPKTKTNTTGGGAAGGATPQQVPQGGSAGGAAGGTSGGATPTPTPAPQSGGSSSGGK